MHQERLGRIQAAPLVSPHGCHLPGAVGAYVCPQPSGSLIHDRRLPHILVYRLPGPMPPPIQTVLPHPHPASLGEHPLPQLDRQVDAMQLPRL